MKPATVSGVGASGGRVRRLGRTLPPTASPARARDLLRAVPALAGGGRGARERFADELRAHFGVPHVYLLSSGKAALTVILRALAADSPRREVVIPAYTCFSVPAAVRRAGLDVVACDIDPGRLDLDPQALAAAVGERTLCVVACNLFGVPSDMEGVRRICVPRGIQVVDDAAQAMGVEAGGTPLGTRGNAGFFSLGRGKQLACGSGGVLLTGSERIAASVAAQVDALPEPGVGAAAAALGTMAVLSALVHPALYWIPAAMPFLRLGETVYDEAFPIGRLAPAQAALLGDWRGRLEASLRARADHAARLARRLPPGPAPVPGLPYLRLPVLAPSREARDRLLAVSRRQGLGLAPMYPTAVDRIPALAGRIGGGPFPGAEAVAGRLVTVPTHPLLTGRDIDRIAALFDTAWEGAAAEGVDVVPAHEGGRP